MRKFVKIGRPGYKGTTGTLILRPSLFYFVQCVLTVIWWQKRGYSLHVTMSGRHDMDMEGWNPYPNAQERIRMGG